MAQYISKDAIVAEIERKIKEISKECEESKTIQFTLIGKINALENLLPFLNTLEVKEVDLEKEFFDWYHEEKNRDYNASILYEKYGIISKKLAKHFFELGLKTKGE